MNLNARLASDLIFGTASGSTDLKIRPRVNHLGISCGNADFIVGANGTMIIPYAENNNRGENTGVLDSRYGNKNGTIAVERATSSQSYLLIRSSGKWYQLSLGDAQEVHV